MEKSDYIPFREAMDTLSKRWGATDSELAIWAWIGSEHGGLTPFDNDEPTQCLFAHATPTKGDQSPPAGYDKNWRCKSFDESKCCGFSPRLRAHSKNSSNNVGIAEWVQGAYFLREAIDSFNPSKVGRFISWAAVLTQCCERGYSRVNAEKTLRDRVKQDKLIQWHKVFIEVNDKQGSDNEVNDNEVNDKQGNDKQGKRTLQEFSMLELAQVQAILDTDFPRAREALDEAKSPTPSRAPAGFEARLRELLEMIERASIKAGLEFDRKDMPGTESDLHALAMKQIGFPKVTVSTFRTYRKRSGLCTFKTHATSTDFYKKLLEQGMT